MDAANVAAAMKNISMLCTVGEIFIYPTGGGARSPLICDDAMCKLLLSALEAT